MYIHKESNYFEYLDNVSCDLHETDKPFAGDLVQSVTRDVYKRQGQVTAVVSSVLWIHYVS